MLNLLTNYWRKRLFSCWTLLCVHRLLSDWLSAARCWAGRSHRVQRAPRLNQNSWSETRQPHTWPAGFHFSFSSNRNIFPSINSSRLILVVLLSECFLLLKVFSVCEHSQVHGRGNISGPQRGEIISMSMIRRPEHKLINSAVARRPDERATFVLFAL